jgi:hypothetical protein
MNVGDWIYFSGFKGSNHNAITFVQERVVLQPHPTPLVYYTLRPLSASKPMWALSDYGNLNVKKDGFRVFVKFVPF